MKDVRKIQNMDTKVLDLQITKSPRIQGGESHEEEFKLAEPNIIVSLTFYITTNIAWPSYPWIILPAKY
jgi:hypothetical protein